MKHVTTLLLAAMLLPGAAFADIGSILSRAARSGADVADAVPHRAFDDLVVPRKPAFGARSIDITAARGAIRAADPGLLRQIDNLPVAQRDLALELFQGGSVLRRANPDELARARLIADGGPDVLVAAQRYGDDFAQPAYLIHMTPDLPPQAAAQFSRNALERGQPFLDAWNNRILPNWKPLVASGAVLACLSAADTCEQLTGDLVRHVAETATGVTTTVVAEAATGAAKGTGQAIIAQLRGPDSLWFILGITGAVLIIFLLRRVLTGALRLLGNPFFTLFRARRTAAPKPTKASLRDREIR